MRIILGLLILLLTFGHASAEARWTKHGPKGPPVTLDEPDTKPTVTDTEDVARIVFTEVEKRIIDRYFGKDSDDDDEDGKKAKGKGKTKGLPPGLAKRETLPPGLARHVELHGTLPHGLQKRNLPADLEALLPPRADQERVIIGDDVVLIEKATGLILDVIEDVLTNGQTGGK